MRILYIVNGPGFYSTFGGGISGGDKRVIEVAKRLSRWGASVHILTTTVTYKQFKKVSKKIKYRPISPPLYLDKAESTPFGRLISYLYLMVRTVLMNLSPSKCDILYSSSDFLCDTIPAWFYKRRHPAMKWVGIIHHLTPMRRPGNVLLNLLAYISQQISFRLIKNCADLVLVYATPEGRRIRDYLSNLGLSPQNVIRISNGIDFKLIEETSGKKKKFDACFVGGLRPSKGSLDLVRIWKEICNRKEDATLLIVGWGASVHMKLLQQKITEDGLEKNVVLAGWQPSKAVFELNKLSKIFVSPSLEEGWGIALCEAMACGLPVVAYDLPAYEIFRGGIITVPLANAKAFANSILLLLEDKKLREKIGDRAKNIASKFDWDRIARSEMRILARLLESERCGC